MYAEEIDSLADIRIRQTARDRDSYRDPGAINAGRAIEDPAGRSEGAPSLRVAVAVAAAR